MSNITRLRGSLLVLGTGVILSFGALVFRETDDIGAWEYLIFRALGALAITVPVFVVQNRRRLGSEVAAVTAPHVAAGVLLGLLFCTFIVALTKTTAAFIVFFQAGSPVAAALCSWFILRERMARDAWIATSITLIGVSIMVSGGLGDTPIWVVPLVLMIPVGLGLYTTLIRVGDDIDPSIPVIVGALTALVIAVTVTMFAGGFEASGRDQLLGLFAGAALLGIPLPLFNYGNRAVPAPEAALLLMSEVVLAPVWVWLIVNERPTDATLLGGAVILASVVWLTVRTAGESRRVRTSRG